MSSVYCPAADRLNHYIDLFLSWHLHEQIAEMIGRGDYGETIETVRRVFHPVAEFVMHQTIKEVNYQVHVDVELRSTDEDLETGLDLHHLVLIYDQSKWVYSVTEIIVYFNSVRMCIFQNFDLNQLIKNV